MRLTRRWESVRLEADGVLLSSAAVLEWNLEYVGGRRRPDTWSVTAVLGGGPAPARSQLLLTLPGGRRLRGEAVLSYASLVLPALGVLRYLGSGPLVPAKGGEGVAPPH
jgi:hypothetical protein